MILANAKISASKFSFSSDVFSAEISDLGKNFNFKRVCDDTIDCGMTIVNEKTGNYVVFAITEKIVSGDDILCWHLQAITPGFKYLKAVIFND